MTSFQDIEPQVKLVIEQSRSLYTMSREQIFLFLADVAAISDKINDTLRDIDIEIGQATSRVHDNLSGQKVTAALLECYTKNATAELVAQREWGKNQLSLMNSLRIAALAAQRSSE